MSRLPALGPRGEGWVVIQFLLLGLVALAGLRFGGAASGPWTTVVSWVGVGLVIGGAALATRGLLDLGRQLTPMPHPRDGAELVVSGIYARVRHPIYGGLIVAAFGWGLASVSLVALALAVVLSLFFGLKSRREEAWLSEHFDGYPEYMQRTKRFLPFLL